MEQEGFEIGRIVKATAGRDRDKLFMIVGIIDENYVWIVNGSNRTLTKPKKKKIKHLKAMEELNWQIREKILDGDQVFDSEIRKILEALGYNN